MNVPSRALNKLLILLRSQLTKQKQEPTRANHRNCKRIREELDRQVVKKSIQLWSIYLVIYCLVCVKHQNLYLCPFIFSALQEIGWFLQSSVKLCMAAQRAPTKIRSPVLEKKGFYMGHPNIKVVWRWSWWWWMWMMRMTDGLQNGLTQESNRTLGFCMTWWKLLYPVGHWCNREEYGLSWWSSSTHPTWNIRERPYKHLPHLLA